MIKIKDLQYRSLWYKKNFYYLQSGQSLSSSTQIAASCDHTMQICQEIEGGLQLSAVLESEDFKNYFSKTERSFIRVAENTGNIDNVFLSLSELLKDQYAQKQRLINAFIYPALVLCMTFGLLCMILLVIIPKVAPLFRDLKNMPIVTKVVIFLSDHLVTEWYIDLGIFFLLSAVLIYFKNNPFISNTKDRIKKYILTKLPYVKDMYVYWHLEKWLKVLHMSVSSGIPIAEAMQYSFESVQDKDLKNQFERMLHHVQNGNTCTSSFALMDKNLYSKIKDWESIIESGEKTGRMAEVLGICHINIKENLLTVFDRFQRMIEPALIICVGIMVLIIAVSIILPMYQLTQSLQ